MSVGKLIIVIIMLVFRKFCKSAANFMTQNFKTFVANCGKFQPINGKAWDHSLVYILCNSHTVV